MTTLTPNVKNRLQLLQGEDGQALVEFALAIPLLLLVLFAIIQFGEAINFYNEETNVTNIATRYATVLSSATATTDPTYPTCTYNGQKSVDIVTYVQYCAGDEAGQLSGATVKVCDLTTPTSTSPSAGDQFRVSMTYSLPILSSMPILSQFFSGTTIPITASATMRVETSSWNPYFAKPSDFSTSC
jgi:Flp pilus assembly protein TadG